MKKETESGDIILKVGGKPFRCECGCNVFRKPHPITDPRQYKCNSCNALYRSEE